ncbi:SERTA domain-containing protein 3 isoform X1 [Dasypus novemcinctus]|uniref:SERTA domain-containing protein 3 isoform X1 n=2 Tax=Dasypus novemcinctus TaxID=9361 RepID=UPI00265D7697|nr:SERTA domain-containing protein 3 isoform X1 [Dasypus novemcinctus]
MRNIFYNPHFTDEETEVQRGDGRSLAKITQPSHFKGRIQTQDSLLPVQGIMVGSLKRKHSDLEEEEETWDWGPAGPRSCQQALLRISLDKVQRGLGPRAPCLRRHVLIHNTLQQLQAALRLAPAPALPPEPLFLGEEDFSLSATIGSILRELETSMDETESPQNPAVPPDPQNEVLAQPDPVFLEALSSQYLGDSGLDDFFLDIDTSAVEKEPMLAPPEPPHNLFCAPGSWEWNELDHIMEIILGS